MVRFSVFSYISTNSENAGLAEIDLAVQDFNHAFVVRLAIFLDETDIIWYNITTKSIVTVWSQTP